MAAVRISVSTDTDVIAQARDNTGLHAAPVAELVRRALLSLAGRDDAAQAAKVPMGRPRKKPRK